MLEQPVSLRDLIRSPVAWLCAGGLAIGLFVLFPGVPAALEVVLLCTLIILLGAAANQAPHAEPQKQTQAKWSYPERSLALPSARLEANPASAVRRRLYVGQQLLDRHPSDR